MRRFAIVAILIVSVSCLNENHERSKRLTLAGRLRQEILDAHNHFRRLEGANDMKKLKWDSTLALMADIQAEKCIYAHGQPDSLKSPFDPTGQNIYVRKPGQIPSRLNYTRVVESWFNEKYGYVFRALLCIVSECGHYTQVVWANTEFVGCASQFCEELDGDATWSNVSLVICNYGPSGNFIGRFPYTKGTACSTCPGSCEDGLCV